MKGVDACPYGSRSIPLISVCQAASSSLSLKFKPSVSEEGPLAVCNFNGKVKSTRVSGQHGKSAQWVCKRTAPAGTPSIHNNSPFAPCTARPPFLPLVLSLPSGPL